MADAEHDRPAHPGAGRRVLRLRRVRDQPLARRGRFPPPVRPGPRPGDRQGRARGFARKAAHTWSLTYDPDGNEGRGVITATIDGETSVCHLDPGHKADGATFDRFGLLTVMKSADSPGELWLDDVTVNGELEALRRRPGLGGAGQPAHLRVGERAAAVRLRLQPDPLRRAARPRASSAAWSSAATAARPTGWPPTATGSARSRSTGR